MNKSNTNSNLLFILCSTTLAAVGQLLFKYALNISSPYLLLVGVIAYVFSTLVYFYVLSRTTLSWAYGMGGISYILAAIFSLLLLGETITPLHWAGIVTIAAGIVLVGSS
jgi:drug/metabolite transporter (DMT)-like permease